MAQITITLELTAKTLEVLKLLTEEEKPAKSKTSKSKKTVELEEKAAEPEEKATEGISETPNITMSDVRAVALKLSKAKKQAQLKEIFAKYGATKLSDIDEAHYADLMADLEAASE